MYISALPHIAVIDNKQIGEDDLTIPLNQNSQIAFPHLPLTKRKVYSYGMEYQSGLLYCNLELGLCSYHKLGTSTWTEPPELQPGFIAREPGCAVHNGKMWIMGGQLAQGENKI